MLVMRKTFWSMRPDVHSKHCRDAVMSESSQRSTDAAVLWLATAVATTLSLSLTL